jgi:WD40 repeat-containing protein SMU1
VDLDSLKSDIIHSRWDVVLPLLTKLRIPEQKIIKLYEHVMFDLAMLHELDAAKTILHYSPTLMQLQRDQPERHLRLAELVSGISSSFRQESDCAFFRTEDREALANDILKDVDGSKPASVLSLLNQSLKWQRHVGRFHNDVPCQGEYLAQQEYSFAIKEEHCTVHFGSKSYPECASFSPEGNLIATGSSDGFVEIWCWETGKLHEDPLHQGAKKLMVHNDSVLALNFSGKGDMIVAGSKDAKIKIWGVRTGKCLRNFERAHARAITVVMFDRDGSHILSASLDGTVRVHGLKSGQLMKEFHGNVAHVNHVACSDDRKMILSASSDGRVRVWDSRSTKILASWEPPCNTEAEKLIRSVHPISGEPRNCVVCTNGNIHLMSVSGDLLRSFEMQGYSTGSFISCVVSPDGRRVYALGEDGKVYIFCTKTCELEFTLEARDICPTSICHHPNQNVLATTSSAGYLRIWK